MFLTQRERSRKKRSAKGRSTFPPSRASIAKHHEHKKGEGSSTLINCCIDMRCYCRTHHLSFSDWSSVARVARITSLLVGLHSLPFVVALALGTVAAALWCNCNRCKTSWRLYPFLGFRCGSPGQGTTAGFRPSGFCFKAWALMDLGASGQSETAHMCHGYRYLHFPAPWTSCVRPAAGKELLKVFWTSAKPRKTAPGQTSEARTSDSHVLPKSGPL